MHLLRTPARLPFLRLLNYTIAALLVFAVNAVAGPVVLDPTFDSDGRVMTAFLPYTVDPPGNDMVIQPDGRIIVVGSGLNETILQGSLMMARYNPDGSLDMTFDGDGKVFYAVGVIREISNSVALQPDGKIVVSWITFRNLGDEFDTDVVTARFNTNGSLDASFGTGGRTITQVAGFNRINDVAVLPNGKIAAVGNSNTTSPYVLVYTADGFLDAGFDTDGIGSIGATDLMAVDGQTDGKVVVTGKSSSFTTWRFNADGTPDTTFNGSGVIDVPVGTGNATPAEMLVKPDGKILMVGTAIGGTNNDIALVQLNSNGTPDLTFSDDGKVTTDTGAVENGVDVAVQPDGRIVALGSNLFVWQVARYHPNGAIDNTFDIDGVATATTNTTVPSALSLQADGKIVATGSSRPDGFVVLRFLVQPAPFDFDGDGKADLSIFRPAVGQWWYQRSGDGVVPGFQFGASTDRIAPGDYTGDGKTDIAIWRPSTGFWFILRSEDFLVYGFPFGTDGDVPVPGDYDGDGKTDAAVFRPSTLTWVINKSSGGVTFHTFGAIGDKPVVADYDGDGKTDIAIYRPSVGEWWYQRSTDGIVPGFQFGSSTDKPVQGDYTGDGKADIAFWRPSTGFWYVLRSEDFLFYAFPWGLSTDVPAPGDFDGDGKFDASVFRPSDTVWYIKGTTSGVFSQRFGITTDLPVPNAFVP